MTAKIVVIGPQCWGAGDTLRQALARARANYAGRGPMPYNSYQASEDFRIDQFGSIVATKVDKLSEVRYEPNGKRTVKTAGFEGEKVKARL